MNKEFWRPQINSALRHPAQYVAYYNGRLLRAVVSEILRNGLVPELRKLLLKKDLDESAKKVVRSYLQELEEQS